MKSKIKQVSKSEKSFAQNKKDYLKTASSFGAFITGYSQSAGMTRIYMAKEK